MRDELTLMELVDRYLGGELNASERVAFEERIRTNAELRALVEEQRTLHGGLQRLALRPAVNKAYRSYKWGKWAPGIGGAAVIALLAVGGWMLAKDSGHSTEAASDGSEQVEQLLTLCDTTGTGSPALVMMINPKADTTLLTPNGLVLDIPKGAFVDETGNTITTPVRVTLLEAINGVEIMKAGLSTMSGDTLLETGGMFYIDAQMDGKRVGIDPAKPLTVMVPSDNADPRMMLYEGVMTEDGIVDWLNPKPLQRTLVPVDIATLDFYPPGYLDKLAELGKDAGDKGYTDSLYFALAGHDLVILDGDTNPSLLTMDEIRRSVTKSPSGSWSIPIPFMILDPAKVQAIWNERFNGTNLATREFEERMLEIHRTCDNGVLDLYAKNLEKNLSSLDSVVARGYPAFATFALRNDGRVQLPEHAAERLRKAYTEWSQQYAEAARKTQEEFYRKEAEADQEAHKRHMDRQMKDLQQDSERFTREFTANLRSAYDQLGYPWTPAPPPRAAFVVPVGASGWWNVDKAVLAATTSRTSMSYTDKKSGKTATLTYTPITVEVASKESFSELRVYLIPKELNSYQRVVQKDGAFTENLNSLFEYDVICMGRKDGQQNAASQWNVGGERTITLTMEPTDDEALKRMIRASTSVVSGDLLEQARQLEWLEREAKRQQAKQAHYELRSALMPVVFPCWGEGVPAE
jgi:hypothetical protein